MLALTEAFCFLDGPVFHAVVLFSYGFRASLFAVLAVGTHCAPVKKGKLIICSLKLLHDLNLHPLLINLSRAQALALRAPMLAVTQTRLLVSGQTMVLLPAPLHLATCHTMLPPNMSPDHLISQCHSLNLSLLSLESQLHQLNPLLFQDLLSQDMAAVQ